MLKWLRTILVLGRVSNLPTVWTNVMVGWFLAGGEWKGELWWLMGGVSLLYVAGMTLNDAFDAGWDAQHAPQRPIPSGAISATAVWVLGWLQMVGGVLIVLLCSQAIWYVCLALVLAILLYDWSHKKWNHAAWVMGACRALVYLLSASAVLGADLKDFMVIQWYVIGLLFYVVGITRAARGESSGDSVGWKDKGWLLAPGMVGLAVFASGVNRSPWLLIAIGVFLIWMDHALRQLKSERPDRVGRFVCVLLAGIILVDLIALSQISVVFWPVCGVLLALTLLAQKSISAT